MNGKNLSYLSTSPANAAAPWDERLRWFEELERLSLPFEGDTPPSESELRIAQAQLVGWLEGLFHGIQATLFAQQLAAQQQLQQIRQLPPGAIQRGPGQGPERPEDPRPGTYL